MRRRAKGEGTIHKRKQGGYAGSLSFGVDRATGKRIRPTVYGDTREEVARKLRDARKAYEQGRRESERTLTAGGYLGPWLEARRNEIRATTWDAHESVLRVWIVPNIGHIRLADLKATDLQRVYNAMRIAGLSPATIRRTHAVVRKALADAVEQRVLEWSPATSAYHGRQVRANKTTLTTEELGRVLGVVRGAWDEARWVLVFSTGMRRGELFGLRWRDIDLDGGAIRLQGAMTERHGYDATKSGHGRRVPLPPSAVAVLREHRRRQAEERLRAGPDWADEDWLFPDEHGGAQYGNGWASRRWHEVLKQAGVPRITLHEARHTFASLSLEAGVPIVEVAAILGHQQTSVTVNTYSHTTPAMERAAVAAMEALLGRETA